MVVTRACKAFVMPYSMRKQLFFLPFRLRVWGVKSKTPFAVMFWAAEVLGCKSSINPLCLSKHSYTAHEMALFSSSHLPDSSNWGTNTSLFRYFYKYKHISVHMHIHDGGSMEVSSSTDILLQLQWAPHRPLSVLLELLQHCQEHGSATSVHVLQEPKGPVGSAVISKWHVLTDTLVHKCYEKNGTKRTFLCRQGFTHGHAELLVVINCMKTV